MPSAGEKAIFAYFFWRLQKSMASGGTRPAGLSLYSPVPAGSRVAFFAGPKKVTKERTILALRSAFLLPAFYKINDDAA